MKSSCTGGRRNVWPALAAALLLLPAGCAGDPPTPAPLPGETSTHVTAEPVAGGTLVLGMQQEPDMLTPAVSRMRSSNFVGQMIFSYFARLDDQFRLVPDLLEEIPSLENGGVSADGLTISYSIRADATWHDGAPVTAADVAFTYGMLSNPETGLPGAHGWDVVAAVETPATHTIVFRLAAPSPSFVMDAFVDEPVLPRHLLAGTPPAEFKKHPFHRAPIGSGPFRVASWDSGERLVLERNPHYFGGGPYLQKIVLRFVPDAQALEAQLATGEIHGFENASTLMVPRLTAMDGVTLYRTTGTVYEHLDMNCQRPPLDDVRVRRALTLAVDRRAISAAVYDGLWPPAFADEPPASPLYDPELERLGGPDPARAARLLTEAGWLAGNAATREREGRPLVLDLAYPAGRPDRERVGILLQSQLARVGMEVQLRPVEPTVFFSSAADGGVLQGGHFDMALFAWTAPPDPAVKEAIYHKNSIPPRGQNVTRLADDRLSDLLSRAGAEMDPALRHELYLQAGRLTAELAPVVPLVWRVQLDPVSNRLRNFQPNPTLSGNSWNASEWWLAPAS